MEVCAVMFLWFLSLNTLSKNNSSYLHVSQELRNRLLKRGTETEDSIEKRMSTASSAIQFSK